MKRLGKILRTCAVLGVTVSASLAALVAACSSSSGGAATQCNANPWQCAAGETCWPKDCVCPSGQCDLSNCVPEFSCQKSISGKQVDSLCADTPGDPSCGDQQTCLELSAGSGHCASFCDPQHPCPSGLACFEFTVGPPGNPTVHACTKVGQDGGPLPPSDDGGVSEASTVDVEIIPTIDANKPM